MASILFFEDSVTIFAGRSSIERPCVLIGDWCYRFTALEKLFGNLVFVHDAKCVWGSCFVTCWDPDSFCFLYCTVHIYPCIATDSRYIALLCSFRKAFWAVILTMFSFRQGCEVLGQIWPWNCTNNIRISFAYDNMIVGWLFDSWFLILPVLIDYVMVSCLAAGTCVFLYWLVLLVAPSITNFCRNHKASCSGRAVLSKTICSTLVLHLWLDFRGVFWVAFSCPNFAAFLWSRTVTLASRENL